MFGLPADFDAEFLVGRELQSVSIARFQVILRFDSEVWISIESDVLVSEDDGETLHTEPRDLGHTLIALLGVPIVCAAGDADGSVTLKFEDGLQLRVLDSKDEYESYQIGTPDRLIVV